MPKGSRPPSTSATTWCATSCSPRSARRSHRDVRGEVAAAGGRGGLVSMLRSVVLGCGSYLPQPGPHQCRAGADGRYLRRMDRAAHRHPRAPHRGARRVDLRPRAQGGARGAGRRRRRRAIDRPDRGRDLDAGQHLSGQRRSRCRPGSASRTAPPSICRRYAPASSMRWRPSTACCATGTFKRALVIGAETFSRILDWTDRTTCVLFGDGAGAVVLEAQEQPARATDRGVLTTHLRSDGRHKSKLYVDGGPSSTRTVGHLRMEGREVFRHAVGDDHRRDRGCFQGDRLYRRRHRLVRAASGQPAHHRRLRPQARHRSGQGRHHRRPARQHVGGLDPAGAVRRASPTAASSRATWCCWRRWAAASPGARRCVRW